jgi:hypothetical protein
MQTHYVPARLDLYAPATITAFTGGATSLGAQPGHGVAIADPGAGIISLTITAANAQAALSASSLGGATIAASNNTLTITGLAAQVNAALQTLELTEPDNASTDRLSLTATEPGELPASTAIAVDVASTAGPTFTAPASLALAAWTLDSLAGLVISDPEISALNAAGEGAEETLQLTLSVASGVLLMPNFQALSGIAATGIGGGSILLTFTADQLQAVNTLLAGLGYAGRPGASSLAYGLRNLAGPLAATVTSGTIALAVAGTAAPAQTLASGADTIILGLETLAGGTITVTAVTSDLGGITGAAALNILPDAAFHAPHDTISLGGTSYDDGTLAVLGLNESGTLFVSGNAAIGSVLNLGSAGFIDVTGTLTAAAQAQTLGQEGFSLAAGADIVADGALIAGNFSNAGRIFGPGAIAAPPGATLIIAAAEISGGATLQIGQGAVMELGPISPLYGVFDSTPLTIDQGTTLAFQSESGADPVTGPFADNLDQRGGVIVINSPDLFAGTIVNFQPGDRLIFPGLAGLTLLSITSHSFVVAGIDANNNTVEYTINAAYQAGASPFVYTDAEGDSEIGLRDAQNDIFLGPSLAITTQLAAQPGRAQPIQGLDLLLRSWTTQILSLTLDVSAGILSDGVLAPSATITLTAATPTLLDAELANLTYTAAPNAVLDALQITATTGYLNGISSFLPIDLIAAGGTLAGFGDAGQVALFAGAFTSAVQMPGTPGEILVTGTYDFADPIKASGLAGTALRVDGGGVALFDAAANIAIGAAATIGDAAGAGFLGIFTQNFSESGNLVIGGNAAGTGSGADIAGALTLAGTLQIGAAAASNVYLQGSLAAAATTIASLGALAASGSANAAFGALTDAGVLILTDQASAAATALAAAGTLILDGESSLTVRSGATESGLLIIGPDADLTAQTLDQTAGSLRLIGELAVAGLTASGAIALAGGTIAASQITLAGATITGAGEIEAATGLASLTLSAATIDATGVMDIGADMTMAGASKILLGAGAALELAHAVNGGAITFTAPGAALTIDDLQTFTAPVKNFQAGDAIDLVGITPGLVTNAGTAITVTDAQHHAIGGFQLTEAAGQPAISIVSDGHGGALITLGGELPCFARSTRILTPSGYRPVESLDPGDQVITAAGATRPIRWIGQRTIDLAGRSDDHPIRFAAGAIAPGIPARPVKLSPLHAVFIDGVLIPALHLVNGATITRYPDAAVTYYHLELDRHDIILADGMPSETFIENGNRGQLHRERGTRIGNRTPCAPLITTGKILARIRRRLHDIALAAGYTITQEPRLRAVANNTAILPNLTIDKNRHIARFTLPPGTDSLAIIARAAPPADTDPASEDRRNLAICLAEADPQITLGAGWHPRAPADHGHWMSHTAKLHLPSPQPELTLQIAAIVQSWTNG